MFFFWKKEYKDTNNINNQIRTSCRGLGSTAPSGSVSTHRTHRFIHAAQFISVKCQEKYQKLSICLIRNMERLIEKDTHPRAHKYRQCFNRPKQSLEQSVLQSVNAWRVHVTPWEISYMNELKLSLLIKKHF